MKYIVAICRILVGVLFIISGLIKANDPIGFSYKLQEYFEVFGMEFFVPFALTLSVLITVFEIVCGVATLIGSRMKLFSWLLLLMIIFFTFLTFYSAYFNKVTDCGCFGDALHLTPWQSFTKDIVLLVWILPIFLWRNKIQPLFSSKLDNGLIIASTIIS
ncbi:MAG: DoxX family protein, partial [Bacteroidota bacterium]